MPGHSPRRNVQRRAPSGAIREADALSANQGREDAVYNDYRRNLRRLGIVNAIETAIPAQRAGTLTPAALQAALDAVRDGLIETADTASLIQALKDNVNVVLLGAKDWVYPARALVWLLVKVAHEDRVALFPPYLTAAHRATLRQIYARTTALGGPQPAEMTAVRETAQQERLTRLRAAGERDIAIREALFPAWEQTTVLEGQRRLAALRGLKGTRPIGGFTRDELVEYLAPWVERAAKQTQAPGVVAPPALLFAVAGGSTASARALSATQMAAKLERKAPDTWRATALAAAPTIRGIQPNSWVVLGKAGQPDYVLRQARISGVKFTPDAALHRVYIEAHLISDSNFTGVTLAKLESRPNVLRTRFAGMVLLDSMRLVGTSIGGMGVHTERGEYVEGDIRQCNFKRMKARDVAIVADTLYNCEFEDANIAHDFNVDVAEARDVSFDNMRVQHQITIKCDQGFNVSLERARTAHLDVAGMYLGRLGLAGVRTTSGRLACRFDDRCVVTFRDAQLHNCDMRNLVLHADNVVFSGATFTGSDFAGTRLIGEVQNADFRGARVEHLDVSQATLVDCLFDAEFLEVRERRELRLHEQADAEDGEGGEYAEDGDDDDGAHDVDHGDDS